MRLFPNFFGKGSFVFVGVAAVKEQFQIVQFPFGFIDVVDCGSGCRFK